MATSQRRAWSDLPVSPGSILKEEIEYRGITQKELADLMGRPTEIIEKILHGNREITLTTATEIQEALGISAQFWLNIESAYRATLAKQEARVPSATPTQDGSA